MTDSLVIGKRYAFMWPARKPMMRLVGTVLAVVRVSQETLAHVEFDPTKLPHVIYLEGAEFREADADEPDGFWVRSKKRKTR